MTPLKGDAKFMEEIVMKYINHQGEMILVMINETQDSVTLLNQDTNEMKPILDVWVNDYLLDDVEDFDNVVMKKWFFETMMKYMKNESEEYLCYIKNFDKVSIHN